MSEASNLGGRLARIGRVGASLSGVGIRYAANRLNGGLDDDKQAADLVRALGNLKGPLVKTAQIAATVPGVLPDAYADKLRQLQADAPAMGWPFVRRRMQAELGENWLDHFAEFPPEPASAASLGQVHRARLQDGRQVACKLQYADMASAVDGDLAQLKLIFRAAGLYEKAVDTSEIYQELKDRLYEELDYLHEARNLKRFAFALKEVAQVAVPEVVDALTTKRLLTMAWLEGERFSHFLERDHPQELRNQVATRLFRAWYTPFYRFGMIHGDPHFGNYAVREDGSVNLFDFGAVRLFEPRFVGGVIALYQALRDEDEERAAEAYRDWGFENLNRELLQTLNIWARFLYAPMLEDRVTRMDAHSMSDDGTQIAHKVRLALRQHGGVKVPRAFVLMDRAAIGMGSVFMRLGAELNWHRLFHELADDFDPIALGNRQQELLQAYP